VIGAAETGGILTEIGYESGRSIVYVAPIVGGTLKATATKPENTAHTLAILRIASKATTHDTLSP
jgi:hypothetical protein